MHQVTGEYPDYQKPTLVSKFYLNANQSFNPYTWKPPIYWEGNIGGRTVQFTQIEHSGFSVNCFDWQGFPEELDYVRFYIVEAIDKAMKVMD